MHLNFLTLVVLAAAAGGAAAAVGTSGCGDAAGGRRAGAETAPARTAVRAAAASRAYLDRHGIALRLGNGFRAGLERLAVLEQPREGAADVGQPLPAGLLRDVRCAPAAAQPAAAGAWPWRCRVRWETASGRPRALRYAVRLLPGGCFAAGARPALPERLDPTIKTYAEDPLNTIVSVRRGC